MATESNPRESDSHGLDAGLLILRGAGLFLLLTYGWEKFWGYAQMAREGGPWESSGLAPLIRAMGFPAPVLLGIYATLCESVGAFLIACGFLTRPVAVLAAISMAGAFYTSLRLQEEPLRAALYFFIFAAVALTGPGKFSVDYWLRSKRVKVNPGGLQSDAGLLALRLGVGTVFVLLSVLRHGEGGTVFIFHPGRAWPLIALGAGAALVTLGFQTRVVSTCIALAWAWALGTGLYLGQTFYLFPVRAVLFVIVFAALAFTGAGRFSVDHVFDSRR